MATGGSSSEHSQGLGRKHAQTERGSSRPNLRKEKQPHSTSINSLDLNNGPMDISNLTQFGREFHDLTKVQTTSSDKNEVDGGQSDTENQETEDLSPYLKDWKPEVSLPGLSSIDSKNDKHRIPDNDEQPSQAGAAQEPVHPPKSPGLPGDNNGTGPKLKNATKMVVPKTKREMMDEHPSYHGAISGEEAEKRLKICCTHGYLTRYSENSQCYVLSVYQEFPHEEVVKHFPITFTSNGGQKMYKISSDEEPKGLQAMLTYYECNRIDPALKNIGGCVSLQEYLRRQKEQEGHDQQVNVPPPAAPKKDPPQIPAPQATPVQSGRRGQRDTSKSSKCRLL